jgi:hypothetical protein
MKRFRNPLRNLLTTHLPKRLSSQRGGSVLDGAQRPSQSQWREYTRAWFEKGPPMAEPSVSHGGATPLIPAAKWPSLCLPGYGNDDWGSSCQASISNLVPRGASA